MGNENGYERQENIITYRELEDNIYIIKRDQIFIDAFEIKDFKEREKFTFDKLEQ